MATYFVKVGDDYKEISLDDIKKSDKLVLESDLLALKGSNETNTKRLEKEIETLSTEKDSLLTRATSAESAAEAVKKELEPLKNSATEAETLKTKLAELESKQSAAETQLLSTKRKELIKNYNLDGDKAKQVESMSLTDIESMEKNLELVGAGKQNGNNNNGSQFDRRNNNDHAETPKSSFNAIRDALANNDSGLRVAHGSSSDD